MHVIESKNNRKVKCMNRKIDYLGIGFIKSRKSEDKLMDMSAEMIDTARRHSLKLLEVVVDTSSGLDVDRSAVDKITAWMEKDYINAIVVRSVFDITNDIDDLAAFFRKAEELGVSINTMELGFNPAYIPWDGGIGC